MKWDIIDKKIFAVAAISLLIGLASYSSISFFQGYLNASLNMKVNKSGDVMTGNLTILGSVHPTTGVTLHFDNITNYAVYNQIADGYRPYQYTFYVSQNTGFNNASWIYTNGRSNLNFSDIHFYQNNVTPLPFWREEIFNETKDYAVFVVNVTGNGTIRMDYGNKSTKFTNVSGSGVFRFYDDFDNLNNWTILSGVGLWKANGSLWTPAILDGQIYQIVTTNQIPLLDDYSINTRVRASNTTLYFPFVLSQVSSPNYISQGYVEFAGLLGAGNKNLYFRANNTDEMPATPFSSVQWTYYRGIMQIVQHQVHSARIYSNDITQITQLSGVIDVNTNRGNLAIVSNRGNPDDYSLDYVYVQDYYYNPSIPGIWSSESQTILSEFYCVQVGSSGQLFTTLGACP